MIKNYCSKLVSLVLALMMVLSAVPGLTAETMSGAAKVQPKASAASAEEFDAFLANLEVLEGYAADYAPAANETAAGLVINYIRTGIDKYNTGSWAILAGAENTAFVEYVAEMDELNGTTAGSLRGIGIFETPNGQQVEFGHMFGALNIASYNPGVTYSADFGSSAGDIDDPMD